MDTGLLVDRILRGSRNIDRMKSEIVQIINMVLGCLEPKSIESLLGNYNRVFDFQDGFWKIYSITSGGKVVVICRKRIPRLAHRLETDREAFNNCEHPQFTNGVGDVKFVYESLSFFVLGMIKDFPELELKLQPFLDASENG